MNSDPTLANAAIAVLWTAGVLFIYFLPTYVARKKRNCGAVFALDLLLGWTLIGWVVALCWALMEDAPPIIVQQIQTPAGPSLLCSACGRYSAMGSKFCNSCGQSLSAKSTVTAISRS